GGEAREFRVDREAAELVGGELGQALRDVEEALDLVGLKHALGEGAELADVMLAREGPGTERVGVGDSDLVDDAGAVHELDLDATAESLLADVVGVVAARPLGILERRDLVPQLDRVGAAGALG